MGQRYYLDKKDFSYNPIKGINITLKEVLTPQEEKELIEIQNCISLEITEPINIFKEHSLTQKNPMRENGLIFCLAHESSKCIGYGYGYIEDSHPKTFYLNTIGVSKNHRDKKIGRAIKVELINYAFNELKLERIKAITQLDNEKTIHINKKLGFKIDFNYERKWKKIDNNIIIAAQHEAGHALMAYIVGWTINSIELHIQSNKLISAITKYNFGVDLNNNNNSNLSRRLLCLMGGPISQALFLQNTQIDIDTMGQDGITIDNMLTHLDLSTKNQVIQDAINTTAHFLSYHNNIKARQQISKILIKRYSLTQNEFHQVINSNNVLQMDLN